MMVFIAGVIPIWISAKLLNVKNASLVLCFVSFAASAAATYLVKTYITPSVLIGTIISVSLIGMANAFIFGTTIFKGAIISVLSGLLLAGAVIFMSSS